MRLKERLEDYRKLSGGHTPGLFGRLPAEVRVIAFRNHDYCLKQKGFDCEVRLLATTDSDELGQYLGAFIGNATLSLGSEI